MGTVAVLGTLDEVVSRVDTAVRDLQPGVFDAAGAAHLVEVFGRLERLGAAGKGARGAARRGVRQVAQGRLSIGRALAGRAERRSDR